MNTTSTRAGQVITTPTGYQAFIPNKLPPTPPIRMDDEMQYLLSMADRELGRLDGITQVIPDSDLFLAMYIKKEAVFSSQIEGIQASLIDVLEIPENSDTSAEKKKDVEDVVNYVHAVNYGFRRLNDLPLSLRLIREMHKILLQGDRGSERKPGEFRTSQNWIGYTGCTLSTATFVPPPVHEMETAMADLEKFFYDKSFIPPLIKIAIIHAQFETIHPFLDGNGRMGRILITFLLYCEEILSKPLLYLSNYFKKNRTEYYDRLMNVQLHGDWENWVKFFLKGISFAADEAINTATNILSLKAECEKEVARFSAENLTYQKFLDYLFDNPIVNRKIVMEQLNISSPTAGTMLESFCDAKILRDDSPDKQRNKTYRFERYLTLLDTDA